MRPQNERPLSDVPAGQAGRPTPPGRVDATVIMKAHRRHELKENDLAHALQVARDYLDENGKRIGIAVIVLVVAVATAALVVRSRAAAVEDVWRRRSLLSFDDPETARQSFQALASLRQGVSHERFVLDTLMDEGSRALRLAAEAQAPPDPAFNDTAETAFGEVLQRFGNNPLAFAVAHNGLATVAENRFLLDGDPAHQQTARQHLTAVVDNPALNTLPIKRLAMDRLARLDAVFTRVSFEPPALPEVADEASALSPESAPANAESQGSAGPTEPLPSEQRDVERVMDGPRRAGPQATDAPTDRAAVPTGRQAGPRDDRQPPVEKSADDPPLGPGDTDPQRR